jgi:hypothetical protein
MTAELSSPGSKLHAAVTDATDDLASRLFALDTEALDTAAVTARITREIVRWALSNGWNPRAEARVGVTVSRHGRSRTGYIDVIVRRGGEPALAIEIDSGDKPWSLDKLRHAAAAGMQPIWVRWGDDGWAGYYDDIDVIQLPALRRSAARRTGDQLRLWP